MVFNESFFLYKRRGTAKAALKYFLREAKSGTARWWPTGSNQLNNLVKSTLVGHTYRCAYCDCPAFKLVNISGLIIEQIAPQEPIYKIPPKGAKDLKIIEKAGRPGGWIAGIGPHDVVCSKCNAFIEHRAFYYLQRSPLTIYDK